MTTITTEEELKNLNITNGDIIIDMKGNYNKLSFPDWIKKLSFTNIYKYEFDNLPDNLEVLTINYNKLNLDSLPLSLQKLYIHINSSNNNIFDFLPNNLQELHICIIKECNYSFDNLPKNLKKLAITDHYVTDSKKKIDLNLLPEGLEELILIGCFNPDLDNLHKLKKLKLLFKSFLNIEVCLTKLSSNLEELFLYENTSTNLNNIPTTLKNVTIHCDNKFIHKNIDNFSKFIRVNDFIIQIIRDDYIHYY